MKVGKARRPLYRRRILRRRLPQATGFEMRIVLGLHSVTFNLHDHG